jgi:hypothetical protein
MSKFTTKLLWCALAIAILLGAIWQFFPLKDAQNRMNLLPFKGNGFIGQDVDLTPFEEINFKDVNLIKRMYRVDDDTVFVTVLDGTHNRHVVHDPYYCFRGSGWEIVSEKSFPLHGGNATLVIIKKGNQRKEALFWFSDGTAVYSSPIRYWYESTLRRITLGYSGPEPILIMIQPMGNNEVNWKKILEKLKPLITL